MRRVLYVVAIILVTLTALGGYGYLNREQVFLWSLSKPPGFEITYFARGVPGARSLANGGDGVIFLSTRELGRIYALIDRDKDGVAEQTVLFADGLDWPNGIDFDGDDLYVAEKSRILRYANAVEHIGSSPEPIVIRDDLPAESHHGWRYLRVGPDRKLYVSIGAPCNLCDRNNYAEIRRYALDGSTMEVYARGARNSIGFDWHPVSREMWFTDNGRDMWGDDLPPDELNRVANQGEHFGYPYCHGNGLNDPEFGVGIDCGDYRSPVMELGPHVASLGMRFYTGDLFPPAYRGDIFIAEHGSWNRSKRIGYRVSMVTLEGSKAVEYRGFIEGWMRWERIFGRPVDVLVQDDGSLLVSDDYRGAVYRVTYKE